MNMINEARLEALETKVADLERSLYERPTRRITKGGWTDEALAEWIHDTWPAWEKDAWLALPDLTFREKKIAALVR